MNEDRDKGVKENNTGDIDSRVDRKEIGCRLIVLLCLFYYGVLLGHRYKGVNHT